MKNRLRLFLCYGVALLCGVNVSASVMSGGAYNLIADVSDNGGWWHSRCGNPRGYRIMSSLCYTGSAELSGGDFVIQGGFIHPDIDVAHFVWQEKTTTRTGPNAFGFNEDAVWTWKVPANGGSLLTITAYVQYNPSYGGASKPKFTLYNYGIDNSAIASVAAEDAWEKLTVSGTPTGKGVLFLKVEGFSTAAGAKYFVDDIQVNQ